MTKPTTLILIRHGETEWNAKNILQGGSDIALSALGKIQAVQTAGFLSAFSIHHLYCSPLVRAADTAAAIRKHHAKVPLTTEELLVERNFGKLEGMEYEAVFEAHPRLAFADTWNYPYFTPSGAEAIADVTHRAAKFVKNILKQHKGATVAAIAHGVTIRCVVSYATGIPLAPKRDMWLDNASVSILQYANGPHWDLHLYNYTGHLTRPSQG